MKKTKAKRQRFANAIAKHRSLRFANAYFDRCPIEQQTRLLIGHPFHGEPLTDGDERVLRMVSYLERESFCNLPEDKHGYVKLPLPLQRFTVEVICSDELNIFDRTVRNESGEYLGTPDHCETCKCIWYKKHYRELWKWIRSNY